MTLSETDQYNGASKNMLRLIDSINGNEPHSFASQWMSKRCMFLPDCFLVRREILEIYLNDFVDMFLADNPQFVEGDYDFEGHIIKGYIAIPMNGEDK